MKRGIWGGIFLMATFLAGIGLAHAQSKPWNKITTARYQALASFLNGAVLDRETGLIWEACPSSDTVPWGGAVLTCSNKILGGRLGWRVPTIEELTSLRDEGPSLPSGAPFCDTNAFLGSSFLWSSTTFGFTNNNALSVLFINTLIGTNGKSSLGHVWCVRGGQGPGFLPTP